MFLILIPTCIVAALLVTVCRVVPMRFVLGYATWVDVTFSILIVGAFHGTLSGMTAATMAGLLLALFLTAGRRIFGYSRLSLHRNGLHPTWHEVRYPGTMTGKRAALVKWLYGYFNMVVRGV